MPISKWEKIDFQRFVDDFGTNLIVENAPTLLYSKKEKEHEACNSLIAFFFCSCRIMYLYVNFIIPD